MLPRLRRRIIPIVQSPWFISLLAALIILPFIPVNPEPFTLRVVSEEPLNTGIHTWYDDLDNDGVPERITLLDKQNGSGLMVQNSHGFIEQWNVTGDYSFHQTETLFITGDHDGDGTKEIYFFSLAGDSILLHTIPDFRNPGFGIHNRFIARAGPGNKRPDPVIIPAGMRDLNGDGRKELIFGITSGFSLYPRNVYAYFPCRDSLIVSPPSCIPFRAILQSDIDGDGNDEIILHSAAPSNCDPSLNPLHDHSSWLVILDNDLRFKHTPYEYPGRYSIYTPIFHSGSGGAPRSTSGSKGASGSNSGSGGTSLSKSGSGGAPLFAGHQHVRQPGEPSWLWRYDARGIATDSAAIATGGWYAFSVEEQRCSGNRWQGAKQQKEEQNPQDGNQRQDNLRQNHRPRGGNLRQDNLRQNHRPRGGNQLLIAIVSNEGAIELYNEQLKHLRTIGPGGYGYPATELDIDGDGEQEIIIPGNNGNVTVFRAGLKRPASLTRGLSSGNYYFRGIAADAGNTPLLAVVSGDQQYMLKYERNRLYLLGYAVYPAVYGGLLLFALMVQRVQRRKMQQQYTTEKRIARLQLNLIRNQLDPHFTMNVLNSIIYSVKTQDPDTASDNLMRFSDLYRNMLMTAGEIRRSLADELAFCSDYLALERMRYSGKFDYSIDVGEGVDREVMIPKMAVQVFAENAVKHGIAELPSGGMIRIGAAMEGPWLVLTVQDNGVGRERAREQARALGSRSTGMGLQLTEDFFEVYRKYYHQEIVWEVRDLESEVRGVESEVRGVESEVRGLENVEVRGLQDVEVRGPESEVRGVEKAEVRGLEEAEVRGPENAEGVTEGGGTGTLVEIRILNPVAGSQGHGG